MAYIKEPAGVDFIIKSEPLTKEEKNAISAFIKNYKVNIATKSTLKKRTKSKVKKNPA